VVGYCLRGYMGQRLDQLLDRAGMLPGLLGHARNVPLVQKAEGSRVYDVDNHGYIDYTGCDGTAMLGYANQFVLDAARKTLGTGIPDGFHTAQEVELAEVLGQFVPWARAFTFHRSGDEAMDAALAAVVALSGKERILFLRGGTAQGSSGCATRERSPHGTRELEGWDGDRIEAAIVGGASKVAAVVVDPLLTACGVIPPPDGLFRRIVDVCAEHGVLMVLDERVTGFRLARDGAAGWAGIEPDIAVYGGALGGGFPIGVVAFGEGVEPPAPVWPGSRGTVHPVVLAAAEAVLSVLKNDAVYERLEERTAQLRDGLLALAERFGRPMVINAVGSVFSIYLSREPVTGAASAVASDAEAYRRLAAGLREEGILLPLEGLRPLFLSHAHSQKDVEETLTACERVLLRLHQEDLP